MSSLYVAKKKYSWRLLVLVPMTVFCLATSATVEADTQGQPSSSAARGLPSSSLTLIDDDTDGAPERTEYSSESTYDNHGNRVQLVEQLYNDQGFVWKVVTTSNSYDKASRLVHEMEEHDFVALWRDDGFHERWLDYDNQGNLVEERKSRNFVHSSSFQRLLRQYDHAGRVIREVHEIDDRRYADGIVDQIKTWTHTYNERGDRLEIVYTNDSDADGVVETVEWSTWTYNERGDLMEEVSATDLENDSVVDVLSRETMTYDNAGKIREELRRWFEPEGTLVREELSEFTYDLAGRLIEQYQRSYPVGSSYRLTNRYDSRGNLVAFEREFNYPDGNREHHIFTHLFDPRGHWIERFIQVTSSAGFWVEGLMTRQFDQNGRVLEEVSEISSSLLPLTISTDTFVYDGWGNVLRDVHESDWDGDGTPENITSVIYKY